MSQLISPVLATLLLICLASFGWGMRRFFVQPERMTFGRKVTGIVALISASVHFLAIVLTRDISMPRFFLGGTTYVAAAGLFWWAIRVNRANPLAACFSAATPRHLNINGPYHLMRHPFYGSYLLACLGGVIATENWRLLPTVIVMFFIYRSAALQEEGAFGRSPLARHYQLYCSRTGRFLPRFSTLTDLLRPIVSGMSRSPIEHQ